MAASDKRWKMFESILIVTELQDFNPLIMLFKDGLSPSKKMCFICFNEYPPQKMKNAFYFMLKAPFVLKIKFLS